MYALIITKLKPPHKRDRKNIQKVAQNIRRISNKEMKNEILSRVGNNSVNRLSLSTLKPKRWLSDEVINIFLSILQERNSSNYRINQSQTNMYMYTSFFFIELFQNNSYDYNNVRDFSRHIPGGNMFDLKKIIVPIHDGGNHWTLIEINFL